jgi:hypothetical protein
MEVSDDAQACQAVAEFWNSVGDTRFERILTLAAMVDGWEDIDSDSEGEEDEAAALRIQVSKSAW